MPTYIDTTNLSPATISTLQGPIITQIQITTSAYVVKDDTAVSTTGGYIKITGANFTAGTQVVIGTVAATSVTYVNATTLNVQVPAQAAGTYVVYVTTNTGSVAILVNGLTYSGDPVWVTGSTLTGGQVDTAISIQLSATGDAPVTYALQAGSSLPPGVTLSSGGLLSGTVTGITSETVYNFTIEAIDGQLQESPRTFSITITANDQYFEYVTSLLSASTPTSTFVTDASTNSFAVTVNGDTRPSNFGPYTPGYYSNYFDGTGDYLRVANNAALELGSSDFTIEFWINWVSFQANKTILTKGYGTIYAPFLFYTDVGAAFNIYMSSTGSSFNIANGLSIIPSVVNGTWYHCVLTRSGSNFATYVNGVRSATFTSSSALFPAPTYDLTIAASIHNLGDNPNCYISNLRIVKGAAVYDPTQTTLTVPTAPLTAIANTSLLTCQSNRFIDNSTNNFTISRFGDTLISGFDPFVPSSSFAGRGSTYFDGTGDYLTLPTSQTALQPGSGDFTIELWYYYATSPAGYINMFSYGAAGNVLRLFLYTTNSLIVWTGATPIITANNAHIPSAWNHVAIVRNGLTVTLYVNGTNVGTATGGSTTNYVGDLSIAFESGQTPFTGYMSDFRMVKGTAVYTANFTPPTSPLTAIANTQLLTLQNNQPNNNSMFLDASTNNFNITRNGNTTQGSFSPYGGGWSNYFGTAQFKLSTTGMTALGSDFTLELWIYPTSFNDYNTIFDNRTSDGDASGLVLGLTSAAKVYFYTNAAFQITTATSISLNTWTHIALVRSGAGSGNVKIYINGVADANTATYTTSFTRTAPSIGDDWGTRSNLQYYGYLSNLRATTSALYTSTFTPSTSPLTAISGTVLLTCQSNRFIDNSFSALTMTVTGTPTIQRFNPFNPVTTIPISYSGYFDGSAAFLSFADNTAFNFGTGEATVEFWFNSPGTSNNYPGIISSVDYNTSGSASIRFDNTGYKGKVFMYINGGGDPVIASTSTISYNTWTHVAITRSGTSLKMYINGTLDTTVTISVSLGWYLSYGGMRIGRGFDVDGASAYFPGYVSNVRLVKGSVVYTANFTPSTTPLTAIANTSLLTLQSSTFVDNSTNNFTITANGNTVPRQFNPFGWTSTTGSSAAYTPTLYGGSAYFDGTGDWLTAPDSTVFDVPGDYTVELWFYPAVSGGLQRLFMIGDYRSSFNGLDLYVNGSNQLVFYSNGASIITGGSVVNFQWNHVALVRRGSSSNNTTLYLNGISVGQATNTTTFTGVAANGVSIGLEYSGAATSVTSATYISDVRLSNGTARYISNFAPPVAPLTALQNTVLLNSMTGAGIYDSSMMANYETVGNTSINTSIKKYGNTSVYFDGTGDYLIAPASQNFVFGTGDFTIECWLYLTATGADDGVIIELRSSGATSNGFVFNTRASGGGYVLNFYTDSAPNLGSTVLSLNTWNHVAVTRSGSTVRLFSNGAVSATITKSNNFSNTPNPTIGQSLLYGNSNLTGYMDDLRITKGLARYTSTFTPPTSPYIRF